MNVIKVIVDELPEGCDTCPLNFSDESNSYCVPLITEGADRSKLTYGMYVFRRHDCPLIVGDISCKR